VLSCHDQERSRQASWLAAGAVRDTTRAAEPSDQICGLCVISHFTEAAQRRRIVRWDGTQGRRRCRRHGHRRRRARVTHGRRVSTRHSDLPADRHSYQEFPAAVAVEVEPPVRAVVTSHQSERRRPRAGAPGQPLSDGPRSSRRGLCDRKRARCYRQKPGCRGAHAPTMPHAPTAGGGGLFGAVTSASYAAARNGQDPDARSQG
jgi:hypothetical protein